MMKKQYFLVEVTMRDHDFPCCWTGHASDIRAALGDHDDVKTVKVKHYKPKSTDRKPE